MRAWARELLVPFFTPLVWCGRDSDALPTELSGRSNLVAWQNRLTPLNVWNKGYIPSPSCPPASYQMLAWTFEILGLYHSKLPSSPKSWPQDNKNWKIRLTMPKYKAIWKVKNLQIPQQNWKLGNHILFRNSFFIDFFFFIPTAIPV